MPEEENNLIAEMSEELDLLKEKVETLERHQHLGLDGSKELNESTELNGKQVRISGAGAMIQELSLLPIVITEGVDRELDKKTATGYGIASSGNQVHAAIAVGRLVDLDGAQKPGNRRDYREEINTAQVRVIHNLVSTLTINGPSVLPPLSFLTTERMPIIKSTGAITQGESTLTDSSAQFVPNQLAGSQLVLRSQAGAPVESHRIIGNTTNVITIGDFNPSTNEHSFGEWIRDTGVYDYEVRTPSLLGDASMPMARLYVGDDIRLGYGSSQRSPNDPNVGTQVQYIKWGKGSPEGVIPANIGSMFLRRDGGAGTTLYIKEDDDGQNTGWVAK